VLSQSGKGQYVPPQSRKEQYVLPRSEKEQYVLPRSEKEQYFLPFWGRKQQSLPLWGRAGWGPAAVTDETMSRALEAATIHSKPLRPVIPGYPHCPATP